MGWSVAFRNKLNNPAFTPEFQLDLLPNERSLGFRAYSKIGKVKVVNVALRGTSVIPSRWNVSFGGFTVTLQGDLREMFSRINKGDYAAVYCTVEGSRERVAVGQLKSITRRGFSQSFVLTFVDLLQALQTSTRRNVGAQPTPSNVNPPQIPLFYTAGRSTSLTANWSPTDTTLSVNTPSYFERETGKNGCIKVSDANGPGPFFLEYASIAGSNLATTPNGGRAAYPSQRIEYQLHTAHNATATHCVQLEDHPADIIGKLITSTGDGSNGPLDTLPASSSFGGTFTADLFDYNDSRISKRIIRGRTSSTYLWKLVFDAPPTNGIRNICDTASKLGQWPVFRQGSVSWRGCFHPDGIGMNYNVAPQAFAPIIGDADIVEIVSHDIFAQNQINQYTVNRLFIDNSTPPFGTGLSSVTSVNVRGGFAQALPQQQEISRTSHFIYAPASDEADQAQGDNDRMKAFDGYTFERLTLKLRLGFAGLVAGDLIAVTSRYLYGLNERADQTFYQKRAMVTASSFDILSQTCTIECVICSGSNV